MNKFLSVLLAAMLLTVAFLPAAAEPAPAPPEPVDYRITQGGSCWLPDGSTRSVLLESVKQNFHWTTPIRLVAFCTGSLPKGAEMPKETLVLNYGSTGRLCRVTLGRHTYVTEDYTATVSSNGSTAIACYVDMD